MTKARPLARPLRLAVNGMMGSACTPRATQAAWVHRRGQRGWLLLGAPCHLRGQEATPQLRMVLHGSRWALGAHRRGERLVLGHNPGVTSLTSSTIFLLCLAVAKLVSDDFELGLMSVVRGCLASAS